MIEIQYSPNYSRKLRKNSEINVIVIHYTGMQSKIESVKRLLSPKSKVSCHYLIDRKGKVIKMVEEKHIAWHAGRSKWKKFTNLNYNSIGIELVNRGHQHGYEKFTNFQINQLIKLCIKLKKKYNILSSNIVGHSDIAPLRKLDPGEKFPWKKLELKNLVISSKHTKLKFKKTSATKMTQNFFNNLYKIGYRYFNRNIRNKHDKYIIKAFQRRFLPEKVTGLIDKKTYEISQILSIKVKI